MSSTIKIVECPRDAMQGIQEFIPTPAKIEYINQLLKVGFDTIDFGSFVSPEAIPQLKDTAEVLAELDLSNNPNLFELNCRYNLLTSLDVRNGNNLGLWYFTATFNPDLYCIDVDEVANANANWEKDSGCAFSTDCFPSSIQNYTSNKKIIKVLDVFGRSVTPKPNMTLFYIYDDGTTEKKLIIK